MRFTIKTLLIFLSYIMLQACVATKNRGLKKNIDFSLDNDFFDNSFTGFMLFDPTTNDTLYSHNSNKYFTPASNTKIFTLYASLKLLPEKIPSLKYISKNDTIYIEGTGDPTLLHPYFKDSTAISFLSDKEHIALYLDNYYDAKLGPGWSWDDYQYYYQPERGSFPMYGNVLTLFNQPESTVIPAIFKDSIADLEHKTNRETEQNLFYYSSERKDTVEIPYRTSAGLSKKMLEEVLNKKIDPVSKIPTEERKVLYGTPTDSLLNRMMHQSDNFLSEQLLILGASTLSDSLNSSMAREYILENYLADLKQQPRWVDGSGLSRYNLFTPESLIHVLNNMYKEFPKERLFNFFPHGGVSGTLEDWYPGDAQPYIMAKTGSLGNIHCLSGYLVTKSGKTLIFSFMNNHFRHPSSEVKEHMQAIFEQIRDTY